MDTLSSIQNGEHQNTTQNLINYKAILQGKNTVVKSNTWIASFIKGMTFVQFFFHQMINNDIFQPKSGPKIEERKA